MNRATSLLLAVAFICSASTGCSSSEPSSSASPPLAVAFAGISYSPDSSGLARMLREMEGAGEKEQEDRLRAFADGGIERQAKQKANYVYGRLLQKQNSREALEKAVARYKQSSQLPSLFERSHTHIAESAGLLGDERAVQESLEAIANSKTVEKKDQMAALYALGQSYIRAGERERARQYFAQVAAADPSSQYALGSGYYLASMDLRPNGTATAGGATELMSATGEKRQQAIEHYRKYLRESPDGRFAEDIVIDLENMPGFVPTAEDHSLFAQSHYARGHWQNALQHWRKAGNTREWFKQGIALLRLGKTAEAKAVLNSGIRNHPNDDGVDDAATTLARMTNRQGAVEVWSAVRQKSSRFADVALYNLALRAPSHAAALPYYAQIVSKYPTSTYASESMWWLAWSDIQAGKGAQAIPKLQAGAARYPETRAGSRFAYWIGKIHERAGKKDLAKTAYARTIEMQPWNYYAYRAQQRINALSGGRDEGWRTNPGRRVAWSEDTTEHWQWPEPPAQLAAQEGDTIAVLTELRQWDEAMDLLPKDKNDALRAFYLAKTDQPWPAINAAARSLKGKPENTEVWQLAYPLLHAKLIAKEAPRKGVDPLLVQALIREESRYNAKAVSSSNALGLMQLLPGTAYGVAKRIGIKIDDHSDIHEPNNNIRMGTDYLGYVQRRHNGNSLFAVASYNGGPNAVAKWAKTMPTDTDVFVENIPFRETRDYVRKVFGSYWNYRSIYKS